MGLADGFAARKGEYTDPLVFSLQAALRHGCILQVEPRHFGSGRCCSQVGGEL